jgi:Flp pilus assembly protein TadD
MATPFLSSEEYDERAHRLYDEGEYETALDTLKEGLRLYPNSVELHVGLGYTRLAREEFVWARQSFEHALVLDGEHEDALVGLGEALLRFGRRPDAMVYFRRARDTGCADDLDLLLSMGRALYRERMFEEAKEVFVEAASLYRDSAEAAAALGYTFHRLGEEPAARKELRRSLHLDPEHHEARIYLGHLLYDSSEWAGALKEFERVVAADHWDTLALWRLIELKRALTSAEPGSAALAVWEARLEELESEVDQLDELLAELEGTDADDVRREHAGRRDAEFTFETHRVRLPDGRCLSGSWLEIVRQIRDAQGHTGESVAQFMRRHADQEQARTGLSIPASEPEEFVLAGALAGHWHIET